MTCGEKIGQAQRKPPMCIKLGKHSRNPPWVRKFVGTEETLNGYQTI